MKLEIKEIKLDNQYLEIIHDTEDGLPFRINLIDEDLMMVSRIEIESLPNGKFGISIWNRESWVSPRKPEHLITV